MTGNWLKFQSSVLFYVVHWWLFDKLICYNLYYQVWYLNLHQFHLFMWDWWETITFTVLGKENLSCSLHCHKCHQSTIRVNVWFKSTDLSATPFTLYNLYTIWAQPCAGSERAHHADNGVSFFEIEKREVVSLTLVEWTWNIYSLRMNYLNS